MKYYEQYLLGKPFILHTDSKSITHAFEGMNDPRNPRNSVLAEWMSKIQYFNFEIRYIAGKLNTLPDMLSRIQITRVEKQEKLKPEEVLTLLKEAHSLGHWGANGMYNYMKMYHWEKALKIKNLYEQCATFCKQCPQC